MKIVINIPTEKVKQVAGAVALMSGDDAPDGLGDAIEKTEEVDVTDTFDDGVPDGLVQGLSLCVLTKILAEFEAKAGND